MASFTAENWQFAYNVEGDGFPLILMPGNFGSASLWSPYSALLGELCRAITYEVQEVRIPPVTTPAIVSLAQQVHHLETLLATFTIERCYLASPPSSWLAALDFVTRSSAQIEGLLLVAPALASEDSFLLLPPTWPIARPARSVPALLLLHETTPLLPESLATLTHLLPDCTHTVLPPQANRQVGHAMMHFLIHRERQRNLVRGASFLL